MLSVCESHLKVSNHALTHYCQANTKTTNWKISVNIIKLPKQNWFAKYGNSDPLAICINVFLSNLVTFSSVSIYQHLFCSALNVMWHACWGPIFKVFTSLFSIGLIKNWHGAWTFNRVKQATLQKNGPKKHRNDNVTLILLVLHLGLRIDPIQCMGAAPGVINTGRFLS